MTRWKPRAIGLLWLLCVLLGRSMPADAQQAEIRGTVQKDGAGLAGVTVLVNETREATLTDRGGRFALAVPAGIYTLTLALGDQVMTKENVRAESDADAVLTVDVPWELGLADRITVVAPSRRPERIIDAPAAVTVVPPDRIALGAPAGQLPRLLREGPGIEAPQNSLYDFNVNTRGINGFLTRRVQTIIDGRDPSNPVTSAPEWWNLDLLSDDIATMELARGPSAALYGPNSFNGVLNITTLTPHESEGGLARITAGSRNTVKLRGRWAGEIGRGWYMRALGERTRSDDFTVSRDRTVEYPGLTTEVMPLVQEGLEFGAGSVRLDHEATSGRTLTLEGGVADGSGALFITPASRGQQRDTRWTWLHAKYHVSAWNVSGSFNSRSGDAVLLSTGGALIADGRVVTVDAQRHDQLAGGRLRVVAGASYTRRKIDSANSAGVQTLFVRPVTSDQAALFAQGDYDISARLKLVAAARFDNGTLHDAQFSPKFSAVYGVTPTHRLRVGFNRAFQVATYTELFANVAAAPALDLASIETPLAPLLGGAGLGFASVPVRVIGNTNLEVEKVRAFEAGYSGVIGRQLLVGADYYYNATRDFISGFLPGVNAGFAPYRLPVSIPRVVAGPFEAAVNAALPGLTNDSADHPIIVYSTANFGRATVQGVELSAVYYVGSVWRVDGNYSWFHFKVREAPPVAPNAPVHQAKLNGTYSRSRLVANMGVRWLDGFPWSSGVFTGPVPAHAVIDAAARYTLTQHWQAGMTIDNVLDNVHYEVFGGNLLRRFALGYLAVVF